MFFCILLKKKKINNMYLHHFYTNKMCTWSYLYKIRRTYTRTKLKASIILFNTTKKRLAILDFNFKFINDCKIHKTMLKAQKKDGVKIKITKPINSFMISLCCCLKKIKRTKS